MAANIERPFDKIFPLANNTMLTVTEVPDCEEQLLKLMETAMMRGFDSHVRLTEIHLPLSRFPSMDSKFWHVPIEDCGDAQVLRFFFEAPETPH